MWAQFRSNPLRRRRKLQPKRWYAGLSLQCGKVVRGGEHAGSLLAPVPFRLSLTTVWRSNWNNVVGYPLFKTKSHLSSKRKTPQRHGVPTSPSTRRQPSIDTTPTHQPNRRRVRLRAHRTARRAYVVSVSVSVVTYATAACAKPACAKPACATAACAMPATPPSSRRMSYPHA